MAAEQVDLDFDEPLGAAQGVIAYSNLDDYYFSGEKHYAFGVYTGYKYQCVEFARRYMLLRAKCIFGQCGPAAEIFAMTTVENVETGETLPFIACKNGETKVKPAVGMTYIYPQSKKMPVGHVAVFSAVGDDWVGIAEQNQDSKSWNGLPYGRKVPLRQNPDGTWFIDEPDPVLTLCSGWLYIEGATYETSPLDEAAQSAVSDVTLGMKVYRPPVVLEKFIAPPSLEKRMIRFDTKLTAPTHPKFDSSVHPNTQASRSALLEQYKTLVQSHFVEDAHAHHHSTSVSGPKFRRAAVARTYEWHSIYAPNEPLIIGGIGEGLKSYQIAERCVRETLAALPAEEIAARFDMPLASAKAAAQHLLGSKRASSALAAGDCLIGTLGIHYDSSSDSYRILHAELDSLNLIIDVSALQDEHAADHGHQAGFRMTSFGNDFNRGLKNLQKWRYGRANADLPIVFLDFGDASTLESKHGFKFANEVDRYHYELERINHLYLAQTLIEFLASKKKDAELGDLMPEDVPNWDVVIISDAFSSVAVKPDGTVSVTENGSERALEFAWKCAPWWAVFEFATSIPTATSLLEYVNAKQPDFLLNPLWTHIASHPSFPKTLSQWAVAHDASKNDGEQPIAPRVIPVEAWDATSTELPPPCSFAIAPHTGVVDPENPARQPPRVEAKPTDRAAVSFHPTIHMLLSSGKRSGSATVEGRFKSADAKCTIYDIVHPAPLSFMPFLHQS